MNVYPTYIVWRPPKNVEKKSPPYPYLRPFILLYQFRSAEVETRKIGPLTLEFFFSKKSICYKVAKWR